MKTKRYLIFGCLIVLVFSGCSDAPPPLDSSWSSQNTFSQSGSALVSFFSLYRWNGALVTQNREGGVLNYHFYDNTQDTWKEKSISEFGTANTLNAFDPVSKRIMFVDGQISGKTLNMHFACGTLDLQSGLNISNQSKLIFDQYQLFQNLQTNEMLSHPDRKPFSPYIGGSIIRNSNVYISYCLHGETYGGYGVKDGPFDNGVFASSNFGAIWHKEHIASLDGFMPTVARTEEYYYYFVLQLRPNDHELCYSRKDGENTPWSSPEPFVKTLVTSAIIPDRYVVATESDVIHVCWLDQRHEKRRRFNLMYPLRGNYEIAYSQRRDSDANWSKDVILSEGLQYAYHQQCL